MRLRCMKNTSLISPLMGLEALLRLAEEFMCNVTRSIRDIEAHLNDHLFVVTFHRVFALIVTNDMNQFQIFQCEQQIVKILGVYSGAFSLTAFLCGV